mmetsp:Transcript_24312/g.57596  ORF Transcript_24312/g.57596 Transcript_24312/m.57596 type:complete len:373 (+) Transcript_24312:79-1197(+)
MAKFILSLLILPLAAQDAKDFLKPAGTAAAPAAPALAAPATQAQQAAVLPVASPQALGQSGAIPVTPLEVQAVGGWHPWHPAVLWPQLSALEKLLAGLTFASMIKAMCMAGNVLVQVSPYPQVKRWELRRSTGEADAAPYVSIAFGGWQWCYYGLFAYFITTRSGFLILVHSNFLGAILGSYYTFTYFHNCQDAEMLQNLQKYLAAVISLVLLQVCALATLPVERALFMTGLVSSFCSFVGAISMLFVLPSVMKSKDSRAIPGPLVTANLASAVVWCICGMMLSDPMIAAPNVVCCISSSLCLYLKYLYPSSDEVKEGDGEGKEIEEVEAKTKEDFPKPVKPRAWKLGFGFERFEAEATPLAPETSGTGGTF